MYSFGTAPPTIELSNVKLLPASQLEAHYQYNRQALIDYIEEGQPREEYGRYGNPGEKVVEKKLAELERGEEAVLYLWRSRSRSPPGPIHSQPTFESPQGSQAHPR